jgi:hypothetical protein
MKKKKETLAIVSFLVGIALALSATPVWSNGFGVGKGAGSVELEFVYLTSNLGDYLRPCRPSGACALSASQRESLERIVAGGTSSLAKSLEFKSAQKFPGFFPADPVTPTHLALYAIDLAQAKVTINLDRLYPIDSAGRVSPLDWSLVLSTVAEYAARLEGLDASEALSFGARIAQRWKGSVEELTFARYQQSARVLFVGGSTKDEAGQLLFADGRKVNDLTPQVLSRLPSPSQGERASRFVALSHLSWVVVQAAPTSAGPDRVFARARGEVHYVCSVGGSETSSLKGKLDLGINLHVTGASVDQLLKGEPKAQLELDASSVVAQGSSLSVQPL